MQIYENIIFLYPNTRWFFNKNSNFALKIKITPMILSMTGYGKAETIINNKKIHVEIKSLNSKNIDIQTRIAPLYISKDLDIRSYLSQKLIRGKVDFCLWTEDLDASQAVTLNEGIIHAYIEQIKRISAKEDIDTPTDNWWEVLSKMPNISQQPAPQDVTDDTWATIMSVIEEAAKRLIDFRKQEGNNVKLKFDEKLRNIASYLADVSQYEKQRIDKIKQNITEGLKSLRNVDYDQNRLEQEMIYYIEKLDINEEKQRLSNHLSYFAQTMENETAQGKKLGFIAQEMGREINTLGSKSNQADMQNLVVKMKDELEQIKEQVLNIL